MPGLTVQDSAKPLNRLKSWVLGHSLPIIGKPLRRALLQSLQTAALAGDVDAARTLIRAWLHADEPSWSAELSARLSQLAHPSTTDAFWEFWATTRQSFLLECASRQKKSASPASPAHILSLLVLEQFEALKNLKHTQVHPLIQLLHDPDTSLQVKAQRALASLGREDSIQELCREWLRSRSPGLAAVIAQAGYQPSEPPHLSILIALKFNHPQVILQAAADQVEPLLQACQDLDPEIALRAQKGLHTLQNAESITALCEIWASSRNPFLGQVLVSARYLAARPFPLRLLTALKSNRLDISGGIASAQLGILLALLKDPDPQIATNARLALENLTNPETQAAFCQIVLDTEDEFLREVAIKAAYTPPELDKRALFLFLTRQWQAYDSFDFDRRHLRLVYAAAPPALRQRISSLVQQIGRTDYLNILSDLDVHQVSASPEDAQVLFRILTANQEWDKLWRLLGWVDLPTSVEVLRALARSGWKPAHDRQDFDRLSQLAAQKMLTGGATLLQSLPPAVRRSTVKVNGRINDVNFHPSAPLLALGTSHPRLVLWDFQQARVTHAIDGFDHSLNPVVFSPEGTLFCGQRGNTRARCSIYAWKDGSATFIGGHTGSVTSLLPVNETRLLSTGRDQQIILWDIPSRRPVQQTHYTFWSRSAALSNDRSKAVLLHAGINLVSLPDLTPLPHFSSTARASQIRPGIARCAAFAPGDTELLIGQFNGQVVREIFQSNHHRALRRLLVTHPAPIEGINFLPSRNLLVTACANGLIAFTEWPSGKPRTSVMMPTHHLTSLHISPDDAFMATGGSEATMVLWDLRILDVPSLFSEPISGIPSHQMPVIAALSSAPEVPQPIRNALEFLHLLLQRRFRFDVQLSEAPVIQPGEFDILLQE